MNILFIGPYRQSDSWGVASLSYLQALLCSKHNITSRPIYMSNETLSKESIPKEIHTAEKNILAKYDVIIQNCLPHLLERIPGSYNIGLFFIETKTIDKSSWVNRINNMDEVWVNSEFEVNNLKNDGITCKTQCIPLPFNPENFKIDNNIKKHNIFTFYYVGEYIRRKNVDSLMIAFYREFRLNESINLSLNIIGSDNNLSTTIAKDVDDIKQALRLYKIPELYKEVQLSIHKEYNQKIYEEHQKCHCLVLPSSGESFCVPVMDALHLGNPIIINKNTGISQVVNQESGFIVNSNETPIIISDPPLPEVYNGYNTWYKIDVLDLQKKMRCAFEMWNEKNNRQSWKSKQHESKNTIKNHSYKEIGKLIQEKLIIE